MHSRKRFYECPFRGHPCPSRYDDQYLLVNHKRHPQEMVLLEDVGQVFDGAKLVVKIPQRRIYISCERTKAPQPRYPTPVCPYLNWLTGEWEVG